MGNQPKSRDIRRQEISERVAAIRTRIADLQLARESRLATATSEQLVEAQHHAATSRAAAQEAITATIRALRRAAEAHERCAISNEGLAAADGSDEEHHRHEAARHRAAAAADRKRAETAQSLLSSHHGRTSPPEPA